MWKRCFYLNFGRHMRIRNSEHLLTICLTFLEKNVFVDNCSPVSKHLLEIDRHSEKDGALQVHVLLQYRLWHGHQLHKGRLTTHRVDSRRVKLEAARVHHGETTTKYIHGSKYKSKPNFTFLHYLLVQFLNALYK